MGLRSQSNMPSRNSFRAKVRMLEQYLDAGGTSR
jgi:hypothetical protein